MCGVEPPRRRLLLPPRCQHDFKLKELCPVTLQVRTVCLATRESNVLGGIARLRLTASSVFGTVPLPWHSPSSHCRSEDHIRAPLSTLRLVSSLGFGSGYDQRLRPDWFRAGSDS